MVQPREGWAQRDCCSQGRKAARPARLRPNAPRPATSSPPPRAPTHCGLALHARATSSVLFPLPVNTRSPPPESRPW
jgi:hypothetical protein